MGRIVATALLVLSACGVPQPSNPEVEPPAGADEAAELVVLEWGDRLGRDLDPADLPPVRWFAGRCLDYGDGDPRCVYGGFSFSPLGDPEIHLVVYPTIHESALAHEALHWALGEDDTADHSTPEWEMVGEVQAALTAAGY